MNYREAPDPINEIFAGKIVWVEARATADKTILYRGTYEGVGSLNGHSMVVLKDGYKYNRAGITFDKASDGQKSCIDFKKQRLN